MDVKDVVQIIQSGSIILAALMALYSIDAWRREYVGKRKMELAEDALARVYEARDIIAAMRHPFAFGGEGESRKAGPNETPEEKRALDTAYVLIERYTKNVELFSKVYALRYRFIAQFGRKAAEPFDELNRVLNELISSARMMGVLNTRRRPYRTEEEEKRNDDLIRKTESTYWAGLAGDVITLRVDKLVADLEATCRSELAGKKTLFYWLNWPPKFTFGKRAETAASATPAP